MLYAMIDGPQARNYSTMMLLYSLVTSLSRCSNSMLYRKSNDLFLSCWWIEFWDLFLDFFLVGFFSYFSTLWVLTAQFPDRSNNPLQASQLATYCLSDHWLPNTNCLLSLSLCIHSVSMVCFLFYIKQYLRLKTESMKYWLASRKHFPDYTGSSPPPIGIWITELPFHFQKTETRSLPWEQWKLNPNSLIWCRTYPRAIAGFHLKSSCSSSFKPS